MNDKPNGPWWSRNLWQAGPLAIGFLMLLAAMLGWVPPGPNRTNGASQAQLDQIQKKLSEHIDQVTFTNKEVIQVLRKICRHSAKSEAAKEDCDR